MNNRIGRNIAPAVVTLHILASRALAGEAGRETLPTGVIVEVPALNPRDRAPWLTAAATICDLANTDLIDAVQQPGRVFLEEIFTRAAGSVRAQIRAPGSWAQPTVDFAAEHLIAVIAGLDAVIAALRAKGENDERASRAVSGLLNDFPVSAYR